ncbi:MAG TPA: hypothetical protein VHY32_10150 [Caulobacteraceae bacterium]|jgi:hypothetical protein|nr:hypothetical protein [Caulobacteraceae bacterium]
MSRLHDAEDDHHAAVRAVRAGVTQAALDQDVRRWRALGHAIVDLARLVSGQCAASAFCDGRPGVFALAVRLAEAIDDQVDGPAWRVIEAQARLGAGE